jgi:hypothetical protein
MTFMAGFAPATPLNFARPCHTIGVAGTSPAMTRKGGERVTYIDCALSVRA